MDLRKLRLGEWIAGISAFLLFVFMFFSWYSSPGLSKAVAQARQFGIPTVGTLDPNIDAWNAFDFIDLVLLITVVAAIGMGFLRASDNKLNLPLQISTIVTALAAFSALLVVYRIVDPPVAGYPHQKIGVFLGFAAVLGVAYGGYRTMLDEGTSLHDVRNSLLGAPSRPPDPPF